VNEETKGPSQIMTKSIQTNDKKYDHLPSWDPSQSKLVKEKVYSKSSKL